MSLPKCSYRVETEEPMTFFCRHSRVFASDHLVHPGICGMCRMRTVHCDNLRPAPSTKTVSRSRPPLIRQAWNLAQAIRDFSADRFRTVTPEQYAQRMEICEGCTERRGSRCLQCGCNLSLKARGRAFQCPLKKWPEVGK